MDQSYLLKNLGVTILELGNGVERTLGKILGTQELILKEVDKVHKRLDKQIEEDKEIERRVQKIETKMSWVAGYALAFITVLTFVSDFVLAKMGLK